MDEKTLQELRELSLRLNKLLSDPHPGLIGWLTEFHDVCYNIGMYCGEDIILNG